ncbi:class B sortase [Eubacteriaceae bacterium ES3]|nr:class B sortase [Eubacteriaceae bacterium ES3]
MNTRKSKALFFIGLIVFFSFIALLIYNFYPISIQKQQNASLIAIATQNQNSKSDERIDFESLKAQNPDTTGWIKIGGTPINYPVMQSTDNDFYLHHNFYKEDSIPASIFLDYLCDGINTRNYVLYGHYMSDESMFGSLWNYQNPEYLADHPVIEFDMPGQKKDWEIFSVYTIPANYDYRQPEFVDDNDFFQYVSRLKNNSTYMIDVEPKPTDTILTLSTCIYTFDDARLVVQARMIN